MTIQPTRLLLLERSQLFEIIRDFFKPLAVVEVDTRHIESFTVTDPYMSALQVVNSRNQPVGYLQTSPEFAMKRLLAQGSGDIYQLSKAFRADEKGQYHDNEFTMLEWYRQNFSLQQLMDEVYQLIILVLGNKPLTMLSYQQAFRLVLDICPLTITTQELALLCRQKLGDLPANLLRDNYLTLLFSEIIEPSFEPQAVTFIYHFPESQASLAKLTENEKGELVAERFEVYSSGVELANGFHELTNAEEQLARFQQDNLQRKKLGYPQVEIDHRLIAALQKGLPDCSGVALGVDRLLMLKLGQNQLSKVLPLGALN